MAETSIKQLEAQIEQLNRLVRHQASLSHTLSSLLWGLEKRIIQQENGVMLFCCFKLGCYLLTDIFFLKKCLFLGSSKGGRHQVHKNDVEIQGRQNSADGIPYWWFDST